jgi:type II secretory pathway pseudopilin PulG
MSAGSAQRGFTLLGMLIVVGVMGAGLAAYGELASHAAQREKEKQLLFVGNQFRQAIGSYYERSPGAAKRFPQSLQDLVEDKRHPMPQRHLRRIYADPITGKPDWSVIPGPDGGIMGVHSRSEARPVKTGGFALLDSTFAQTGRYSDWTFSYVPGDPPASRPN